MSIFKVEIVVCPEGEKHPNADSLFVAKIFDYPVIYSQRDTFKPGDLVAYIPVDAMVPLKDPRFSFLDSGKSREKERVRAKKLRGIFSMGLLIPAPEGSKAGEDVAEKLNITKYEEPEHFVTGDAEKDPGFAPHYTDIQNYRRYKHVLNGEQEVFLTEKLHGCNAAFFYKDERLWVRSHRQYKKRPEGVETPSFWWKVAKNEDLETKLKPFPDLVFFGEVFGANVQDLTYGAGKNDLYFRVFDVFDIKAGSYKDYHEAKSLTAAAQLEWVPELYRGPINESLFLEIIEKDSHFANCIREGVVIRPLIEKFNPEVGRVILKLISQRYLLRKGGTEKH